MAMAAVAESNDPLPDATLAEFIETETEGCTWADDSITAVGWIP